MNLRKDHYRLLVYFQTRDKPPLGTRTPESVLGVLARLPALATSLAGRPDLLSAVVSRDGPRLSRYRTPFTDPPGPVSGRRKGELWDVCERFKEPSPRPGFVISPMLGCAADTFLLCLSLVERDTVSGRRSENEKTQHYTVDHLARGSMKNGANSVMPCELQDT